MILEINQLINSGDKYISKIGWLIYNREDQNGGLNKQELEELLGLLTPLNIEDIIDKHYEKGKQEGFEEGYQMGLEDGKVKAMELKNQNYDELLRDIITTTKRRNRITGEYD
jgi:flagellar biosynthesis/type III secretory pathway protein FliH